MEQQEVVEPFEKTQQPHQTLPFHCDSEMIHTQNPPAADDNDFETQDLGLGSEVDELAVFEPVQSEKLSLGEDGMLRDDDFDDEVERVIIRELKELVLSQAMSEQKGSVENSRSYEWGEYEEEEYAFVESGEEKWGREEGFREVGDVENGNGDDNWGEFDAKKMGYGYEGFGGVGNVENGNGEESWGREEGKFNGKKMVYPLRPDAEDCAFYMKTGSCKFGFHCKFNHPPVPRRKYQAPKDKIKPREEHLERSGQAGCKYFLSSAGCKYGQACKYNHSRERSTISPASEFNFLGLPIRPGEQECPYYMRNGSCKYGSNCRFHHPDPTAGSGGDPSPYGNGAPVAGASQSSPRALSNAASFVPMMYPPAQGVHSSTDWSGYQASVYPPTERSLPTPPAFTMNNRGTEANFPSRPVYSPTDRSLATPPAFTMNNMRPDTNYHSRPVYQPTERTLQTPPAFTMNNLRPEASFHSRPVYPPTGLQTPPAFSTNNLETDSSFPSRHHQPLFMDEFPERPGQPECSYFLKTGDCKYKSNCKFHHPKSRVMKSAPTAFSDKGLPLRPEEAVCSFYLRYGICKFGPACKFDHPDNLGNTVYSSVSEFEQSSFGNGVA